MENFLNLLEKKLVHKKLKLEKEELEVFQFPDFTTGEHIDLTLFKGGTNHPSHIHKDTSSKIFIIEGRGNMYINGDIKEYSSGNVFDISKGTPHGFDAKGDTLLLSLQDKAILYNEKLDFEYLNN